MSVVALKPGYAGEMKDRVENFHGQQLLNIGWEDHLMFASPVCIPVTPDMPFSVLVEQVLPSIYAAHPDASKIEWDQVEWFSSGVMFKPDMAGSVSKNGLAHKAMLRFRTPGLRGIVGSCS